jgi:hypothetical protein
MRKELVLLTSLCLSGALMGCHSSSNQAPEQAKPEVKRESQDSKKSSWAITLKSKCDVEIAPEECVGQYGFSIDSDGKYKVGPGLNNETKAGEITAEELNQLKADLSSALAASQLPDQAHATLTEANASEDTNEDAEQPSADAAVAEKASDDILSLTKDGKEEGEFISTVGKEIYYKLGSSKEAEDVHKAMRKLAKKYYGRIFPDACQSQIDSYSALLEGLKTCQLDQDCTYLDGDFNDIDASRDTYVLTPDVANSCYAVKAPVAANSSQLLSSRVNILEEKSKVEQICGERIKIATQDCFYNRYLSIRGPNLEERPAVCVQNVCQKNPQSSFIE